MRNILSLFVSIGALATAELACAQEAAQAENEGVGLADIIVTAQKRGENLQDVPIAVANVSADQASQFGVVGPEQLTQVMPGVTFTRQAQGGIPFIRGVGTTISTFGNEPSVALYVDDVYLTNGNGATFQFNDIESIEVLKGPQGTLFGRNATGGVINVRTRRPSHKTAVDVNVSYANYDTITMQGFATTGLTDSIAISLAGYYSNQRDGWGKNYAAFLTPAYDSPLSGTPVQPGSRDLFTNKEWGIRGKLLFELGPDTELLLSGSHGWRHSDQGFAFRPVLGLKGRNGWDPTTGAGVPVAPGFLPTATQQAITGPTLGFYDGADNVGLGGFIGKTDQFSAKFTHDFGTAKLVSISSYGKVFIDVGIDTDASPYSGANAYYTSSSKSFTQELQLLSPDKSAVKWIIGAFYMHDRSDFDSLASGAAVQGAWAIPPLSNPANAATVPIYQDSYAPQETDSFAAFGQATFEMLPRTNLTIGVRYTADWRSTDGAYSRYVRTADGVVVYDAGANRTDGETGLFYDKVKFDNVTGRIALDHKVNDDVMVYAAYNRGFKSGVYNISGYNPAVTSPLEPAKPEEINAYTVGFKSELFDRRVRLNVEGYYYDYSNIQVFNNRPDGTSGTILVNGGKATIKGVDIDLTASPIRNLTLTASVNVQSGKYDEFDNGPKFFLTGPNAPAPAQQIVDPRCNFTAYPAASPPGAPLTQILRSATDPRSCSLAGNDTVMTPPFTLSLSASYLIETAIGNFDLAASYLHSGHQYFEPDNLEYTRQPLYDVVNGSITWRSASEALSVKLWGNNLTGAKYYSYIASSSSSATKGAPAAPRTYGVTLGYHY